MQEPSARWDEGKGKAKDTLLGREEQCSLTAVSPHTLPTQKNGDSGEGAGFWQEMRNVLLDTCLGYDRTPVLGSEHRSRGTVKREGPQVSELDGWT